MSTPAMAFASCSRAIIFSFLGIWIFTLTISRIWTFHHALQAEFTKRKNERWLVQQCDNAEFFFHLKEHTDLCAQVVGYSNSNPFLNALYSVATTTHLCGTTSCTEMAQNVLQRLGWQVVGLLVLLALFSPNVLFLLYRSSVSRYTRGQEDGLLRLYNRKHGLMPDHNHPSWSPYYAVESSPHAGLPWAKSGLRERRSAAPEADDI